MAAKKTKSDSGPLEIRRGDVLWINCDPSIGVEPRKQRTCVVVSNDEANRFWSAVTVIPTVGWSGARAKREFLVDLSGDRSTLRERRLANASMITTYDRDRIVARAGRVSVEAIALIDDALKLHLALR
jgi:mRNA interferase MazF